MDAHPSHNLRGWAFAALSPDPSDVRVESPAATVLAKQLGTVPDHLSIESHTDSLPYSNNSNYGNWELSNAGRRLMQETGLRSDHVLRVRG